MKYLNKMLTTFVSQTFSHCSPLQSKAQLKASERNKHKKWRCTYTENEAFKLNYTEKSRDKVSLLDINWTNQVTSQKPALLILIILSAGPPKLYI